MDVDKNPFWNKIWQRVEYFIHKISIFERCHSEKKGEERKLEAENNESRIWFIYEPKRPFFVKVGINLILTREGVWTTFILTMSRTT